MNPAEKLLQQFRHALTEDLNQIEADHFQKRIAVARLANGRPQKANMGIQSMSNVTEIYRVINPSKNKADNHGLGFVRADTLVFSRLAALAAENDALRSEIASLRGRSG